MINPSTGLLKWPVEKHHHARAYFFYFIFFVFIYFIY